jgi:peptidoglycan/xylan/chitin deacetylase (PgdA/CDA1 family)
MRENKSAAKILLYHGVTASASKGIENFSKKHIPIDEFESQMAYLKENTTPLTLRDLVKYLNENKSIPSNSVAVTFDDTYKNVHDVALPKLKKYQIPATFFISTGFVGNNVRFWTDQIEHFINITPKEYIELKLNNGLAGFSVRGQMQKQKAVIDIKAELKKMSPERRAAALLSLQASTEVNDNGNDVPNYANLTTTDLGNLDALPLFEVGGHTVNHEILTFLNDDELNNEIYNCKKYLEDYLCRSIDLFAYPEGEKEHISEHVISVLKNMDISICPTAINGLNYPGTDSFKLKRIMVGFMGERFPYQEYYERHKC